MVGYLVGHGADVNATDNDGETALHRGASSGREDCVRRLLGAGADASIKAHSGRFEGLTALQVAEQENEPAVAALLRQRAVSSTSCTNSRRRL